MFQIFAEQGTDSAFCGAHCLMELAKITYIIHQRSRFLQHFIYIMSSDNVSLSQKWIQSQC